ncbi:hypothetical protein BX600DRAFT_474984 [Xylariales sp. PMI_506]|nr:hypothetical protein BX600DRAFT_474984 [Xylariales sp. PMI_506]
MQMVVSCYYPRRLRRKKGGGRAMRPALLRLLLLLLLLTLLMLSLSISSRPVVVLHVCRSRPALRDSWWILGRNTRQDTGLWMRFGGARWPTDGSQLVNPGANRTEPSRG